MMLGDWSDLLRDPFEKAIYAFLVTIAAVVWRLGSKLNAILKGKPLKTIDVAHKARFDSHVHGRLFLLLHELGRTCVRVYVSQFHNGDFYVAGNSVIKKTRTHEVPRNGADYQQDQYKGLLCSMVHDEIVLVDEDGPSLRRVADLPIGRFKYLCEKGGVDWVARYGIRNPAGDLIAFVGVDFDGKDEPTAAQVAAVVKAAQDIQNLFWFPEADPHERSAVRRVRRVRVDLTRWWHRGRRLAH